MKNKLIFSLFLFVGLTSVMVGGTVFFYARSNCNAVVAEIRRATREQLASKFQTFDLLLAEIEKGLDQHLQKVMPRLAAEIISAPPSPAELSVAALNAMARRYGVDDLYVIDRQGRIFNTTFATDLNFNLFDVSESLKADLELLFGAGRVYVDRVSFSSKTGIIRKYAYYGPTGGDILVEASVNIRSYIAAKISPAYRDYLFDLFFREAAESNQYIRDVDVFMVNRGGRWSLLHEGRELAGPVAQKLLDNEALQETRGSEIIEYTPFRIRRNPMELNQAPPFLGESGWLRVVYDFSPIQRIPHRILRSSLALAAVAVALAFLLATRFLNRFFVHRVLAINAGVNQIAAGNLANEITVSGTDEIAGIAQNLNRMRLQIAEREKRLRDEISERKRAESAFLESEDRLLRAQKVAQVGSWELDLGSGKVWGSDQGVRIYGLELSSPYLPLEEVKTLVLPEDRGRLDAALEGLLKRGETYDLDFRIHRRNDGELRWIHSIAELRHDDQGTPLQVLGTIQDISDRKRVEEALAESRRRLKTIIDAVYTGILVIDAESDRIIEANPAAVEMFDAAKEDILGTPFQDYFSRAVHLGDAQPVTAGQAVRETAECTLTTAAGDSMQVMKTASRIILDGRDCLLVSFIDLTEKKRLENQLLQAQKMEAIGTLAGGIAHDFNNSLQAISGYAQLLLLNKADDDPDVEKLNAIENATLRAKELTQQLLAFSRKVESNLKPLDLNHEVQQVQKLLESTIPKMIAIRLDLEDRLKVIRADSVQLEQVMMNLAINASHAMPEGGELTFTTRNATLDAAFCRSNLGARPGAYILLQVTDTGCGIPKTVREHIFEPFFTTKTTGEGTGLGLAMVYGIVKNHGGYITCNSEVKQGTTFSLYFPVVAAEHGQAQAAGRRKPLPRGSETILLVDDEKPIRTMAKEILERFGYSVLTAESGEAAVEVYTSAWEPIHLVLLDLNMPGMGGQTCLEMLLALNPALRVVIASGRPPNGEVRKRIDACGGVFIQKPYQIEGLLTAVRQLLDRP